jgi:hypothetical protein
MNAGAAPTHAHHWISARRPATSSRMVFADDQKHAEREQHAEHIDPAPRERRDARRRSRHARS